MRNLKLFLHINKLKILKKTGDTPKKMVQNSQILVRSRFEIVPKKFKILGQDIIKKIS